jgi:hypothetical protein
MNGATRLLNSSARRVNSSGASRARSPRSRPQHALLLVLTCACACRSETPSASKASSTGPGSISSVALTPPAEDSAIPFKTPTSQREGDLAHRLAADSGLSLLNPQVIREDTRLPPDVLTTRDTFGISLDVDWKGGDWPNPSNAPETDRERLSELRNATHWAMRVDLASSGRMRLVLRNRGFALEGGSEFRARVDLLGHFLIWPNENQYRPLGPGTIRQIFEDGRADVGQLLTLTTKVLGSGHWLEWDTERVQASTPFGSMTLDRATNLSAGVAGRLLCRWLIEFINGEPAADLCQDDAVPLRAVFDFSTGGKGEFVVNRVLRKQEFSTSGLSVPPTSARIDFSSLPRNAHISGLRLAGLRVRPTALNPTLSTEVHAGLLATNRSLGLRALIIDGVVAAWLWPGEELQIPELMPGVYSIAWRDFLGLDRQVPTNIPVPAHVTTESVQ